MEPPKPRWVTLRDNSSPGYSLHESATLGVSGALSIAGQSLSRSADFYEYEWAIDIAASAVPALAAALSGNPDTDVLDALTAYHEGNPRPDITGFLKRHDIPYKFWSRVGD